MKRTIIWMLSLAGLLGLGGCHQAGATAPHFSDTTRTVLLSNKVDTLSDEQEMAFYHLARRAAQRATKAEDHTAQDWARLKDESLYVEKTAEPQVYGLGYTVQATEPIKLSIRYDITVKLKSAELKGGKGAFELVTFKLAGLE